LRNESDNIFGKKIEHISARHGPQSARWRAGGLEGFKQPIGTATPGLRPSSSPPSRKRKKIIKDKAREERKASGGDSFEAADKVEAVSVCGKPAGKCFHLISKGKCLLGLFVSGEKIGIE
jgi:hypothetical protein